MSPGRHVIPSPSTDRISVTSNARRSLNFGGPPATVTSNRLAPSGVSWADKVKASHPGTAPHSEEVAAQGQGPPAAQKPSRRMGKFFFFPPFQFERRDAEGWETVQRGRPVRSKSSALVPKTTSSVELSQFKDDSNKENVILPPPVHKQKGSLTEDGTSKNLDPVLKDHQCRVFEELKVSEKITGPLQPVSEVPLVLIDVEGHSESPQVDGHVTSVAPTSDDAENSMAEVLAKKEELADRLEKANEEAIASAIAEEEQLTREIEAEENTDINLETDNDSDFSASLGNGSISFCGISMDWNDVLADYEARESWRQNNSWGDIVEEEPARPPGHGIHMHEKLSSPSRKRTIAESKKKHEEKQMKAQQLREKLREEKTLKLQKLMEREKDVKKWKEELLDQRRRMMEEKLLHAEFKREVQLQAIVKKAQEEEAKVNEIAFINTLEAQNKRHDVLSKLKEYEQRLNELQEERQRRQEEKQARDEAVQERKRALEAERQARHDESIRRHMEQIEQRKEKAAELSSGRHANTDYAPKLTPYERKKQCSLCNVVISSEVYLFSHIKGKKHQQAVRENSSIQGRELSDEEVVRAPVLKKIHRGHCGRKHGSCRAYKRQLQRLVKDLLKQLQIQDGSKISTLDRILGDISRILEKENGADQVAFHVAGGFSSLEQVLQVATTSINLNSVSRIPLKSLCSTISAYYLACNNCLENCIYVLFSNKITFLMDLLMHQLMVYVPDDHSATSGRAINKQAFEGLITGVFRILAIVFESLMSNLPNANNQICAPKLIQDMKNKTSQAEIFNNRIQDLISYMVNIGLIEKLSCCFLSIQGPIDETPKTAAFLQSCTAALLGMCQLCFAVNGRQVRKHLRRDPPGSHRADGGFQGHGPGGRFAHALLRSLPRHPALRQTPCNLRFFNSFAVLDLSAFQSVVGAEGLSLAFRHIISSLLWHCSHHTCEVLLHEVIVQSGRHPTVLQKLCQLPFQYFSDPRLIKILFPTLIAACYNNPQNKIILEQEMSCVLLATFIQDSTQSSGQTDNQPSQQRETFFGSQDYLELSNRFPSQTWEDAWQFFLKKEKKG
ncbi:S phase cyclin A-associated protein in the endoplasmic reticulum, partial [Ophiophagus hannah]